MFPSDWNTQTGARKKRRVPESASAGEAEVSRLANAVDKSDKGGGGDTVTKSITADETCTPVSSETAEISVDNADCKRGTQTVCESRSREGGK